MGLFGKKKKNDVYKVMNALFVNSYQESIFSTYDLDFSQYTSLINTIGLDTCKV